MDATFFQDVAIGFVIGATITGVVLYIAFNWGE